MFCFIKFLNLLLNYHFGSEKECLNLETQILKRIQFKRGNKQKKTHESDMKFQTNSFQKNIMQSPK